MGAILLIGTIIGLPKEKLKIDIFKKVRKLPNILNMSEEKLTTEIILAAGSKLQNVDNSARYNIISEISKNLRMGIPNFGARAVWCVVYAFSLTTPFIPFVIERLVDGKFEKYKKILSDDGCDYALAYGNKLFYKQSFYKLKVDELDFMANTMRVCHLSNKDYDASHRVVQQVIYNLQICLQSYSGTIKREAVLHECGKLRRKLLLRHREDLRAWAVTGKNDPIYKYALISHRKQMKIKPRSLKVGRIQ